MDRFIVKFNLRRLKQEEIEIMNKTIIGIEIETMIKKNLPQNKNPVPNGFTGEIFQTFREELIPILPRLFQKLQRKEHFKLTL